MTTNDKFIAEYGEDAYTRIFEVVIGDATYDDITLEENHMRDAVNYYGYVTYRAPNGSEVICNFECGNWDGSQITSYGVDIEPVEETVIVRRFVLDETRILLAGGDMNLMRLKFAAQKDAIAEKERAYNYDMTFSPTSVIASHYREWAQERYLTVAVEDVRP